MRGSATLAEDKPQVAERSGGGERSAQATEQMGGGEWSTRAKESSGGGAIVRLSFQDAGGSTTHALGRRRRNYRGGCSEVGALVILVLCSRAHWQE